MEIILGKEKTDVKTVIVKKKHDVKIEDEYKFKDLPSDETITVFTLHKEFYDLDKDEKIKILKGLIDFSTDEIGKIRYKIQFAYNSYIPYRFDSCPDHAFH